jgi:2-polyprenyl-3-methyl-5-hydroxy-6-metoxy-1,4-benzoquinol methylase
MQDIKRRTYNLKVAPPKDFDRFDRTRYQSKNPFMNLLMERFYTKLLNQISKYYNQDDNFTLLDVGCGIGIVAKIIHQNFPNARITGFDISYDAVESAKLLLPSANIHIGNIYEYPYDDRTFDMVICLEVLEHLDQPDTVLDSIGKICKKHAIFSIPNDWQFRATNIMLFKYLEWKGNSPGHINEWNKNSFKSLLSRHSFRTINISVVMGIWMLFLCEKLNLDL